jgi:outer membrane protein assembly factor BamD (BamD/ComL family)
MLQARLGDDDYEALRLLLIDNMGKRPDDLALAELLIWYFVQARDFESAFVQARAIDRRFRENGYRLMQLAAVAIENKAFAAAFKCYSAVAEKPDAGGLALEANYRMLTTRQAQFEAEGAQKSDWEAMAVAYQDFMRLYPLFTLLPELKQALAAVWAFQLQQIDSAIQLLDQALQLGRGDQRQLAAIKLDLGDLFLLADEPYEAALLYGQVEKDYPNEPLGQEAKFRNARLSFYRGEFDWAQAQLDVLKASTTQRIANDAIALSLLITENYDMDTVTYPMEIFAAADLRAFCRQYAQANQLYDSLLQTYPGHALTDEVLFRKAKIALELQQIDTAAQLYQRLLADFAQDLYGDDALFGWAVLEADKRNNKAEAMRLFERLLLEYPDSHYINEARRRYRALRGDNIN